MRNLNSTWHKQVGLAVIAIFVLIAAGQTTVSAQSNYKPGDRVECNTVGSTDAKYEKYYEKGTVMPFRDNDRPDGSWYRVKADSNKVEYYCRTEHIRPTAGGNQTQPVNRAETGGRKEVAPAQNGNSVDGEFIDCPVKQKPVRNGSRPDVELFKKIIRCAKGEKSVEKDDEGAVKVEISDLRIGAARPWSYSQDLGNAKPGTIVYPVKATYTVKTFYRTATEVEEGWIRILNFYVNAFGEWQIGSQENVKSPKVSRIQN